MKINIIYTESEMLLSKKTYESWREIQDTFSSYKSSLGPWSCEEVVEFLVDNHPKLNPSAKDQVSNLIGSSSETIKLTFNV